MRIHGAVLETVGAGAPYAASRPLVVDELELDGPGPGEVLVEVEAASVCHSDLSVVDGSRPRPVPMLLGHEAAGRVVATGDGVDLATGARVAMTFLPRCGECPGCLTGGRAPCLPGSAANASGTLLGGAGRLARRGEPVAHHLGVSGFATHAVLDRRSVVEVADDVPPEVAALLGCAVLTGGGAVVNVLDPAPGSTVAVVGLGGVGLAAALAALAYDGVRVIGIDRLPHKLEAARDLGVHEVTTPEDAIADGIRADGVVEAVGRGAAFTAAMALTAPGGTTVTVGLPAASDTVDLSPLGLVAEGRTVVGSYLGSAVPARDVPRFADLWRHGRLPVERLVTSRVALSDVNQAMDALAAGAEVRQILDVTR